MNEKNINTIVISIYIALFVWIFGFIVGMNANKSNHVQVVTNNDTIVLLKSRIDTIEKERIKIKEIYEKQIDTIYLYDSIAIDSAYTKTMDQLRKYEQTGFFK
jgi:hypothetical protein